MDNINYCKCKDDSVCKKCFSELEEKCNIKILDNEEKEAQLKKAIEDLEVAKNEISGMKSQFYTAIGFLLIITTAINSSIYFYSKELPSFISSNKLFLNNSYYGIILLFSSPLLLIFFTFLFVIWFYRSVYSYESHPIWVSLGEFGRKIIGILFTILTMIILGNGTIIIFDRLIIKIPESQYIKSAVILISVGLLFILIMKIVNMVTSALNKRQILALKKEIEGNLLTISEKFLESREDIKDITNSIQIIKEIIKTINKEQERI